MLPSVAVPVANMTRAGYILTHAQTSYGEWRPIRIHGGIPQGSYESAPLFALAVSYTHLTLPTICSV
eukprot:8857990-Prorocentrum_lima.AAC.1